MTHTLYALGSAVWRGQRTFVGIHARNVHECKPPIGKAPRSRCTCVICSPLIGWIFVVDTVRYRVGVLCKIPVLVWILTDTWDPTRICSQKKKQRYFALGGFILRLRG